MTDLIEIIVTEAPVSVSVSVTEAPVEVDVTVVQGIGEAPVDGETYGRKDGDWSIVVSDTVESDPVFLASVAAGIDAGDISNWDSKQAALGYTPVNKAGDTMSGDLRGKDFVATRDGTITRDGNGYISSIAKAGGRTITITRDGNGYISSAADGTNTWTLTRDGNGNIASWAVT